MTLFEELKWRGLIQDISSPELEEKLNKGGMTFYIGTDPTADSLHLGHYSSFLITKRLAMAGHKPIILVGGATALIGDPRGTGERELAIKEVVEKNFQGLKAQVERLFGFPVVNNYDWIKNINLIDFLRDYGKQISVNYMLAKDLIRRQLETGISYAEFSYTLLQGLDFKHLHDTMGVNMQVAGSDQWGNITTGIELIRRIEGDEVYAFTMPLIVDSHGKKFGKSEGNAVWLDKNKTSPYKLYQYLINSEDSMVISYLKKLTFLTKEEIEQIEAEQNKAPEKRIAQKRLAFEVVKDLHGEAEALNAQKTSEELFANGGADVGDMPSLEISKANLGNGISILDLLVSAGFAASRGEAKRLIQGGGVALNRNKILDIQKVITLADLTEENNILQKGKKTFVKVVVK